MLFYHMVYRFGMSSYFKKTMKTQLTNSTQQITTTAVCRHAKNNVLMEKKLSFSVGLEFDQLQNKTSTEIQNVTGKRGH